MLKNRGKEKCQCAWNALKRPTSVGMGRRGNLISKSRFWVSGELQNIWWKALGCKRDTETFLGLAGEPWSIKHCYAVCSMRCEMTLQAASSRKSFCHAHLWHRKDDPLWTQKKCTPRLLRKSPFRALTNSALKWLLCCSLELDNITNYWEPALIAGCSIAIASLCHSNIPLLNS